MTFMKILECLLVLATVVVSMNCTASPKGETKAGNEPEIAGEEAVIDTVVVLNKADFLQKIYNYEKNRTEWVYEGNTPAIIDFYADWCGPCKMVAPILKDLAKEYKGKILIYKINTDKERELATAFGISSIPTYLLIPTKGEPQMARGAMPRESFVQIINEFLLK
jgi:thioredoxin